jgi:NTE family protein
MLGLVLTAGGARGAYQAGVLKRIGELVEERRLAYPFPIIAGSSAGAINGTMLAAGPTFARAAGRLADLWCNIDVGKVFRTDPVALARTGALLARDLSLGGAIGGGLTQAFFDTAPLRELLASQLALDGIGAAIRRGDLYALAISATSYHSGRAFTFVEGRPGHPVWTKSRRVCLPAKVTVEHVLASSSIPILFPPVLVRSPGEGYFGDGGLRQVTPLSPAIRLGARRLFAIGVRCAAAADALSELELGQSQRWNSQRTTLASPPLAQVCGVFLNAIFLDHLDADLDHLQRMNELVATYERDHHGRDPGPRQGLREPMRIIEPFVLSPSEDIALVARQFENRMPAVIRYLLDGLGTPNSESADLMSYLLFDAGFTRALVDIGYSDAERRIGAIEALLCSPEDPTKGGKRAARAARRTKAAAT